MLVSIADGRWELRGIDPDRDPTISRALNAGPPDRVWTVGRVDMYAAVRLIGWSDERPVVVAYKREPAAPIESQPVTGYQAVHSLEVWRLTGTGHEVLLTTPHNLMSIDIADSVLAAGRVRPADPPRFGIVTVLGGLIALLLAASAVRAVVVRRRSSR